MAAMTDVWRYMAGDSINSVPATLTTEQKASYPIAKFRSEWQALSDSDKEWFKDAVSAL